jgi:DNA-directed RNA polymerase specialized sigma24 family protein
VSQDRKDEAAEMAAIAPLRRAKRTQQHGTVTRRICQVQHRLTAPEVQTLVAAYQHGRSMAALARDFELDKSTVRAHLVRAGIELRPQAVLTPAQVAEVVLRYKAGNTLKQLGPQFGVSHNTIRNYLMRERVQLRAAWRQPRHPPPR